MNIEKHMKKEKIGNVCLDYTFYLGKDSYTDGQIEDVLLEACKNGTSEKLLHTSNHWAVLYHLSEIRENLLEWYPFTKTDNVLEIGAGCGALTGILSQKAGVVTCIELSEKRSLINAYRHKERDNIEIYIGNFQDIEPHVGKFDYVTLIGVWEYSGLYIEGDNPYLEMLSIAKKHLKPNGRIIIAIENKMGLKYWNGAVEDHTGGLYSGLNDYINDYDRKVRTFSKIEIESLLQEVGIKEHKFYYPMPDYKLPDVIYNDSILPMPGAERNFGKDYSAIRFYNFNDAVVSDQLCADGVFPYFANSFLIITDERDDNQTFLKYNRSRKKEFQTKVEILKTDKTWLVKKSALNKEAQKHIFQLKENESRWSENPFKIKMVRGDIQDGVYVMPYIEGVDLDTTFYKYRNNAKKFVDQFIFYIKTYFYIEDEHLMPFHMSEEFKKIFGEQFPSGKGCLKYTNVDMTSTNLRLNPQNELFCIDFEWVLDFPIPYEFVIWRCAVSLYIKYRAYFKNQITEKNFFSAINLSEENIRIYKSMEQHFDKFVCGENSPYLRNYRKSILLQSTRFV